MGERRATELNSGDRVQLPGEPVRTVERIAFHDAQGTTVVEVWWQERRRSSLVTADQVFSLTDDTMEV